MAEFTQGEKETLEKLRKEFEKKGSTVDNRTPWQELFSRETSVSTGAVLGTDLVEGLSGSWAASYNYGYGAGFTTSEETPTGDVPTPIRAKRTKLGERGLPDIDFVPFNWNTNRFGSKGPSLIGHPISYRVVGPTLKSPFCDWTWSVQQGTGPNGGDVLVMTTRPDGGAAVATTILEGYNVANFTIGDLNEPNGGLYVLITDDGSNPGSLPGGATAMPALANFVDTAKYELFRVSDVRNNQIELHPNKPLGNYFNLPAASTRAVRAVTVIQPYVTRLAAVPNSGPAGGREQTFVVVSPENAASSDLYPPYNGGVGGDGSWLQGGFEILNAVGSATAYGGSASLPIPIPLRESSGTIEKDAVATAALAGQFIIENVVDPTAADIGRLMHIYHVDSTDGADLTYGSRESALGWFQIAQVVGSTYTLNRVAEVSPTDGSVFFGPGPFYISGAAPTHPVYFTIHNGIRNLWLGAFSIDNVDAVRLKNLIDPVHVQRAEKKISDTSGPPGGSTPGRADRAIFDTRTDMAAAPSTPGNPGSLLDLGFRMVLFPARASAVNPVPDFNRPITSREVVIDPSVTETQYIDIDYSAGIVRLSHAPPSAPGGSIVPNGIIGGPGSTNPRSEVVLFAACIPYSMEPSQLGPGVRVAAGVNGDEDVYGERIVARIDTATTVFTGAAPYFGAGGIVLDRVWEGPPTGVIDILAGDVGESGIGPVSLGTWGYTEIDNSGLTSVLQLVSSLSTVSDPTPVGNEQRTVVLRREVFFGTQSASNSSAIDDVRFDTVYGSSRKAGTLRFPGATLRPRLDGSTEVTVNLSASQLAFSTYQWGYFTAAALPAANALSNKFYSENGFAEPLVYQDNGNPVSGAAGGGFAADATQGPRLRLASLVANGDYKGVMSEAVNNTSGLVAVGAYTRYITKFSISAGGEDYIFFTGLIGTSTGATTPDCNIATSVLAPPADIRQIGLRVYGPPGTEFGFFGLGTSPFSLPTNIVGDNTGTYYFVMETLPGPEVRYGLFDGNFQLLVQGALSDPTVLPADGDGLYLVTAIRKTSGGAPRVNLDTWFTQAVTRYDTQGPPLLSP